MATSSPASTALLSVPWRTTAGWTAALLLTAVLGGLGSRTDSTWYRELTLPAWQPPGPVFGVVWPILYVLTALSAILGTTAARTAYERRVTTAWFAANLVLNVGWTWIFFVGHRPMAAGVEILFLLATIVVLMLRLSRTRPLAAWLLVPYLLWVSFATALTWQIAATNS